MGPMEGKRYLRAVRGMRKDVQAVERGKRNTPTSERSENASPWGQNQRRNDLQRHDHSQQSCD